MHSMINGKSFSIMMIIVRCKRVNCGALFAERYVEKLIYSYTNACVWKIPAQTSQTGIIARIAVKIASSVAKTLPIHMKCILASICGHGHC